MCSLWRRCVRRGGRGLRCFGTSEAGAEAGAGARADEVGRVWEEAIDTDLTKRFEAVARAERERERGKGRLVAKLVKAARRKESREALGGGRAL